MGCVSSKLFRKELEREITVRNNNNGGGDFANHVVSLTSSTYGVLKLDNEQQQQQKPAIAAAEAEAVAVSAEAEMLQRSPPGENPEVINAWELMEGLEEEEKIPVSSQVKKSPKTRAFLKGFGDIDPRSPLKFLNQIGSPRKAKSVGGKENRVGNQNNGGFVGGRGRWDYSPRQVFRVRNSSDNPSKAVLSLSFAAKGSPNGARRESFGSPLFDPELVASYEKELSAEEEHIKRMVPFSPNKVKKSRNSSIDSESVLCSFEKKCPPGGENSVVIYTTTLRGIRKTFEDCNKVRSIMESHLIHVIERDVSMDSGFREELRRLMGTKEVKVPLVFVKGRLVGGAEEVVKLEEEGKLGAFFDGIPRAFGSCKGCAGFRFVMCGECNGSCKVLDEQQKKMVRCGECNENGLVQCPICC